MSDGEILVRVDYKKKVIAAPAISLYFQEVILKNLLKKKYLSAKDKQMWLFVGDQINDTSKGIEFYQQAPSIEVDICDVDWPIANPHRVRTKGFLYPNKDIPTEPVINKKTLKRRKR